MIFQPFLQLLFFFGKTGAPTPGFHSPPPYGFTIVTKPCQKYVSKIVLLYNIHLLKRFHVLSFCHHRPISLVPSFPKLIAKILADKARSCMGLLVSAKQYALIKHSSLHDNFFSSSSGGEETVRQEMQRCDAKTEYLSSFLLPLVVVPARSSPSEGF